MRWAKCIEYTTPTSMHIKLHLLREKFGQQIALPFTTIGIRLANQETQSGVLYRNLSDEESVIRAFRELCAGIEAHNSSLVEVYAAGAGPSQLSRKVRFKAIYLEQNHNDSRGVCNATLTEVTRTHTLTIAASMVEEKAGRLYTPRWFLRKKIIDRHSKPNLLRIAGSWDGETQLWYEVFKPLDDEIKRIRKELGASEINSQQHYTDPIKNLEKQAAKKTATPRPKPRKVLTALKVPTVEWDAWVDAPTRWGKQKIKRTFSAKDCVLRFSYSRIYIDLPDGKVLIKSASNVRY